MLFRAAAPLSPERRCRACGTREQRPREDWRRRRHTRVSGMTRRAAPSSDALGDNTRTAVPLACPTETPRAVCVSQKSTHGKKCNGSSLSPRAGRHELGRHEGSSRRDEDVPRSRRENQRRRRATRVTTRAAPTTSARPRDDERGTCRSIPHPAPSGVPQPSGDQLHPARPPTPRGRCDDA